jgi:hypothetical protein
LRVDVGEGAFANLADAARRAAGVDDEGFGHFRAFLFEAAGGLSGFKVAPLYPSQGPSGTVP